MNDIDVSNYEYGNDVNTFAESISDTIYECVTWAWCTLLATLSPTLLGGTGCCKIETISGCGKPLTGKDAYMLMILILM